MCRLFACNPLFEMVIFHSYAKLLGYEDPGKKRFPCGGDEDCRIPIGCDPSVPKWRRWDWRHRKTTWCKRETPQGAGVDPYKLLLEWEKWEISSRKMHGRQNIWGYCVKQHFSRDSKLHPKNFWNPPWDEYSLWNHPGGRVNINSLQHLE